MMKQVLFVLTYYHPHWTGLTQYAKRVAEGLAERKWRVQVLTTQHDSRLRLNQILENVEVKREPVLVRISRTLISPGLLIDLVREIRQTDRVIVFLPLAEVLWIALLARLFNKPVYLVHNGDLILPRGWFNRVLEKIYDWTTGIAIVTSKAIVIHTRDYAQNSRLLSKCPDKWRVILPPIASMRPRGKLVTKKTGEDIIGFAGRFVEEKGFDVLIKAIPIVLLKRPKTKFVFAGETRVIYENFFERVSNEFNKYDRNIMLLGLLSLEQMADFYAACDVFVVSSRSDCFPVTQIEAMFCGTPVVVTNIPGARWPVKQTGMGVVVETENPEELAHGIIEVLENRKKYVKRKTEIAKIFNYEKSIDEYERLIK